MFAIAYKFCKLPLIINVTFNFTAALNSHNVMSTGCVHFQFNLTTQHRVFNSQKPLFFVIVDDLIPKRSEAALEVCDNMHSTKAS